MSQDPSKPAQSDASPLPAPFRFRPQDPWPGADLGTSAVLQDVGTRAESIFGLQEPDVVVSGLALLASAMGRWHVVDDGLVKIPPAFSVLFVSESNLGTGWMNYLGRAWFEEARQFEKPDPDIIEQTLMEAMDKFGSGRSFPGSGGRPGTSDASQVSPEVLLASLGKRLICRDLNPVSLSDSILRSPDLSVTILNGAPDPLVEWMALKRDLQNDLNGMLRSSWKRVPVNLVRQERRLPATLNLVGTTGINALHTFVTKAACRNNPPPILFVRQRGPGKRFPVLEGPEYEKWSIFLRGAHRIRTASPTGVTLVMKPAETALAENFVSEFRSALASVPPAMVPYLDWIPELALRLYVLMKMSAQPSAQDPSVEKSPGSAMKSALRLTRWLAQEQFAVLQGIVETRIPDHGMPQGDLGERADGADGLVSADTADSDEMDVLKKAILVRLARDGPTSPRDLQRSFHRLDVRMRDEALRSLKLAGEIVESAEGRIALPV